MNLSLFGKRRKGESAPPSQSKASTSLPLSFKAKQSHQAISPPTYNSHTSQPNQSATSHVPQMFAQDQVGSAATAASTSEFGEKRNGNSRTDSHTMPTFLSDGRSRQYSAFSGRSAPPTSMEKKGLRRMSTGSIPSLSELLIKDNVNEELQLCYGYWPIETQRDLTLEQIEDIVRLCGQEIKMRGMTEPLLFSTQALDISVEGVSSLIRAYTLGSTWTQDIKFASPHDLAGMIKWALGRYQNPQGQRGIIGWDMYERWRFGERERDFPPRYITTHMLYLLPTHSATLLETILSLLTTAVAYRTKNGCTARKLASIFGSFIFGLPDDKTFEQTYTAYNRFTHATEHLILAYVRDQTQIQPGIGAPPSIPLRLQELVQNYAMQLPINVNKPPLGAELLQVYRIKRNVRFYSKDLIETAGNWNVPRSANWARIAPYPDYSDAGLSNKPPPFQYSTRYRHLLNIRSTGVEDPVDDLQTFKSVVDKQWRSFMDSGFAPPDESKLRFDLTETERANRRRKYKTMDWSTFEGAGFTSEESALQMELLLDPAENGMTSANDVSSAKHRELLASRAKKLEKALPPFNYDITPSEDRAVQVDKLFFEVYADVLCASGWTRDEVKESNWSLIQLKTRPDDREHQPGVDDRTEDTWFLVEEAIPPEYKVALLQSAVQKPKSSRRISFLRSVRKKSKQPPMPTSAQAGLGNSSTKFDSKPDSRSNSPNLRYPDVSVFSKRGATQKISLMQHSPVLEEDSETLQSGPGELDNGSYVSISTNNHSDQRPPSREGHKTTRNSLLPRSSKGPAAFFDMMRQGTRRRREYTQPTADTVENIRPPLSPSVQSAQFTSTSPSLRPPQSTPRAPSFAGTIDTYVTQGHGNPDAQEASNSSDIRGNSNPAQALDRSLPPTPINKSMPASPVTSVHPSEPPSQKAEVASRDELPNNSTRYSTVSSGDPYDGIIDDVSHDDHVPTHEARLQPADDRIAESSASSPFPAMHEMRRNTHEVPMYPMPGNAEATPMSSEALETPRPVVTPSEQATSPALSPALNGHKRSNSIQEALSKEIEQRKALLERPTRPVQGSGRVAALAGQWSGR